jgi:hypothetical protein
MEQCFSLIAKQPQPAYKPQKPPAEQGDFYSLLPLLPPGLRVLSAGTGDTSSVKKKGDIKLLQCLYDYSLM